MRNHPIHRTLHELAGALPPRGVQLLSFALALVATGAAVVLATGGIAPAASVVAPATTAIEATASIPVLPTVVVRPEPEIPTLATVTVRADDTAEPSARSARRTRALPVHAVTSFASAGSAGTGFGMPYYSFGKPLHSGTEE